VFIISENLQESTEMIKVDRLGSL